MKLRVLRFLLMFAVALCSAPSVSSAQQAGKVYRIGYLANAGCPIRPDFMGPFRQGLRELGYVEGQNIIIECRGALGVAGRLSGLAAELVRLNVDVLVAQGTASALAAKQATKTIPIVMVYVGDPVGSGLVIGLARPGGNVTGLSVLAPDHGPQSPPDPQGGCSLGVSGGGMDGRPDESRPDVAR